MFENNIIYKNVIGGNCYVRSIKENFRCMSNWLGTGNVISIVTSNNRLAIYNWSNCCMCRFYVVSMLKRRENTYDYCCKKSSKMLKRYCKINFWNKGLKNLSLRFS